MFGDTVCAFNVFGSSRPAPSHTPNETVCRGGGGEGGVDNAISAIRQTLNPSQRENKAFQTPPFPHRIRFFCVSVECFHALVSRVCVRVARVPIRPNRTQGKQMNARVCVCNQVSEPVQKRTHFFPIPIHRQN